MMPDQRLAEFAKKEEKLKSAVRSLESQVHEGDEAVRQVNHTVVELRKKLEGTQRRLKLRNLLEPPASRFVTTVATLAVGAAVGFILGHLVTGSWQMALGAAVGLEVWLVLIVRSYLYVPSEIVLVAKQAEVEAGLSTQSSLLQSTIQQCDLLIQQRSNTQRELDELQQRVVQYREQLLNTAERMSLLKVDWRSLRGIDFERFLEQAFRALGYETQLQGRAGDQGVDLLIRSDSQTWAVQAKGYEGAVSNSAIQEVVAGMYHYRCTRCAVVTNSVFTRSARELAESNNCLLIEGESLADLLQGSIAAFPLAYRPSAAANRQASAGDT